MSRTSGFARQRANSTTRTWAAGRAPSSVTAGVAHHRGRDPTGCLDLGDDRDRVRRRMVFENVSNEAYRHGSSVNGPGRGLLVELQGAF